MNAQPMSFGFGFWLNWLFAYMGGKLLTVQSLTHTHSNGDIFHDSDNMPKHVADVSITNEIIAQISLVRHSYEAHLHNSKCSEDDIR